MDAHKFVMDSTDIGKYDIIMQDINCLSEDQSISPPWNFLSAEFLGKLTSLANPESSFMCMNVLYYDNETKTKVFDAFNKHVKPNVSTLAMLEVEGWTNKVFVFARDPRTANLMEYHENQKTLEGMLKQWKISKSLWMQELEMAEHLK